MRIGLLIIAALSLSWSVAQAQEQAVSKKMTKAQMVASATSAAPKNIGKAATVIAVDDKGTITTIRAGTNGFTCMADNPATPGPDPMCMDKNAMEWVMALLQHRAPSSDKIGFMYMLKGGTDASNTDPFATKPTPGNNWIKTGSHVMIVGGTKMTEGYARSAQPDTSQPYVMWPGTPYEHLMLPVK